MENDYVDAKNNHKKGELKEKQIIVHGLQNSLLSYVGNLRKFKDMYDNIVGMYEVNNLNEIISLKYQLKGTKMKKESLCNPRLLGYLVLEINCKYLRNLYLIGNY